MNTCKITTNSWYTPIDKLMLWRGSWTKYDSRKISNTCLRVVCDQLLITADTKILETFNMHQKIKGIYKDDVLILIVNNNNNEIRKIKFQLKSNVSQCLEVLSRHFPVMKHHTLLATNPTVDSKYRNIDEVLKYAVERQDNTSELILPAEFENFVKLCLLDPTFPQMVCATEKILFKDFHK